MPIDQTMRGLALETHPLTRQQKRSRYWNIGSSCEDPEDSRSHQRDSATHWRRSVDLETKCGADTTTQRLLIDNLGNAVKLLGFVEADSKSNWVIVTIIKYLH